MKISVVIPVFNGELTIIRAIESVLNQSVIPHEVNVVDDGSTDKTFDRLVKYKKQLSNIDLKIFRIKNSGPSAARNFGVKKSSGNWIAFLDSDDFWYPWHLENLQNVLHCFPKLKWASSAFEVEVNNNSVVEEKLRLKENNSKLDSYLSAVQYGRPVVMNSVLINRNSFNFLNGFREDWEIGEDTNLWFRFGVHFPEIGYSSKISSRYIYNPKSLSHNNEQKTKKMKRGLDEMIRYASEAQVLERPDVIIFLNKIFNNLVKIISIEKSCNLISLQREYRKILPMHSISLDTMLYVYFGRVPGFIKLKNFIKWFCSRSLFKRKGKV